MESLSAAATLDPEGYLGNPVNAFKLMKRLNTEWAELESLVLSDTTDGMDKADLFQIMISAKRLENQEKVTNRKYYFPILFDVGWIQGFLYICRDWVILELPN